MSTVKDAAFMSRRDAARTKLDQLPGNYANDSAGRLVFFDAVYEEAKNDAAAVPWADLEPKGYLLKWLRNNPGEAERAIDIGCGLGDNAEAIAAHGYQTTGFDVAAKAITWAQNRFPQTDVAYQVADLFNVPEQWAGGFDLVHECFTLQALPPEILSETVEAVCGLVASGGTLLVYTRYRENGAQASGPPWPIEECFLDQPKHYGLSKVHEERTVVTRGDKSVPHHFSIWKKQ